MKPKLEQNSRILIEKNKLELKMKEKKNTKFWSFKKSKKIPPTKPISEVSVCESNNVDENMVSFFDDESTPTYSRRSSYISSLADVTRNESFDSDHMGNPQRLKYDVTIYVK